MSSSPEQTLEPGSGSLVFRQVRDRTIVAEAAARSPLRLLTPRNHGRAAWVYTSGLGGGLVDGDTIRLEVEVEPQARAFLSTQGATRAYRSPGGTRNLLRVQVGSQGLLVYHPDPLSPFAGARLEQRVDVSLAPSASLVLLDVLTAGRVAMGERWAFGSVRSTLRIARTQASADAEVPGSVEVLADETLLLDPTAGSLSLRMRGLEAIATLVLAGPQVAPFAAALHAQFEALGVIRRPPLFQTSSQLAPEAWLFRFGAQTLERLQLRLAELLSFVPSLLGDDPFARRP